LQKNRITNSQSLAISHAPEAHTPHDGRKRPVGHLCGLLAGLETGQLEGASLQPLLIEEETVAVPAKELHRLAVLAEEDENVTAEQRTLQFLAYQFRESVDAEIHPDIVLAHIIPPAFL
jgi:hypothetical protein